MDTKLFARHQLGGIWTVIDKSLTTGNIFWVDSGSGTGSNNVGFGQNPDKPFLTWDYAVGKCTVNNGDLIYLMAGHAETLTAAGAVALDVAGVTTIGLGEGADRPTFTFSSTDNTASVLITAASNKVKNIVGVCGDDGLTNPFHVQAADCELDITWRDGSATVEAVRAILTTDAADRLKLNLKYEGYTGGSGATNAIRLVGVDGAEIDIDAYGLFTTAVIEMITTASTDVNVRGYMYNSGTTDLSKSVKNTGGLACTWFCKAYDGAAGCGFSGGSGAALSKDDVSIVASDLVIVLSDMKAVDVEIGDAASDLVIVVSDLKAALSDIIITEANVDVIKSDVIIVQSDLKSVNTKVTTVASDLVVVMSDVKTITISSSDINVIISDVKIADALIDTIKSDLIVTNAIVDTIASDLILVDTVVDAIKSDLIVADVLIDTIKSDLIIVMSDVKAIDTEVGVVASDLVVTNAITDSILSDLIVTNAIVDTIASDLIVADTAIDVIKSDVIVIQPAAERLVIKTIADMTGFDTAAMFTVTGDVMAKVFGVVGVAAITSTSGTTTLSLGTSQAVAGIIAATTIDNAQFDATDVWVDTSPSDDVERDANAAWFVIGGGADIMMTRSADDITAGALTLYCWWKALSAGATVIAA